MAQLKKERDNRSAALMNNDTVWRDLNAQIKRLEWVLQGGEPLEEASPDLPDGTAVLVENL